MAAHHWQSPMATGSSDMFVERLRRELASPPVPVDAATLAQVFRHDTVTVVAIRPPSFADFPDLVLRVRGALGNALYSLGPPVRWRKSAEALPRAWDILQVDVLPGLPKPMVLQTDVVGDEIRIHAHLTGHGAYWLPDVEAALVAACDGGISLSNESKIRTPLEVLSVHRTSFGGFVPPAVAISEARLLFETPMRLRSGLASRASASSFIIALANRIKGLASWQGYALEQDWSALHHLAWNIEAVTDGLVGYRWERGSQRAKARIPVLGLLGELIFRGNLGQLIPFLQVGEAFNAGSHASLGLGRYKLLLLP